MILLHTVMRSGRQVKMAFIHTVAKPPRDVRIQQEIHGTAVQQPSQGRCRWDQWEYFLLFAQMLHFFGENLGEQPIFPVLLGL